MMGFRVFPAVCLRDIIPCYPQRIDHARSSFSHTLYNPVFVLSLFDLWLTAWSALLYILCYLSSLGNTSAVITSIIPQTPRVESIQRPFA